MMPLQILLADDHEILRCGIRGVLEAQPGWEVCGEAENGRQAVEQAQKLCPDIVILDINMPGLNGVDVARAIKRALPETEILVFSGQEAESVIHAVFQAGARGYLCKADIGGKLVEAVKALSEHKTFMSSKISAIIFERYLRSNEPGAGQPAEILTPRERETVQLLAEGKSNKEVAVAFGISVKTAEAHRAAIIRKLGLKSFSELIRYAIRNHLIEA